VLCERGIRTIAVGADGVIVDVHPSPETALCDGPQALIEADLRELASVATHPSAVVGRTLTPAPVPGGEGGASAAATGEAALATVAS
jgi:hypothetical protein